MNTKALRQKILDLAIHGKLVPPVCRQAGKTLTTNPESPVKGKKCWFTYVIECVDGSFYKGFTDNLLRRYQQHCNGTGAEYTKMHKPKQLFYWEMHYSEEAALKREKYLKSGIGREWFKREVVDKPENFEPASVLLERIRAEKERLIKEGKIKKPKKTKTACDKPHYPFELPKGWVWCKLEDIAYVASGSTPEKSSFVSEGIPYIKMYNLRNQEIDFDYKPQYIKEEVHNGKLQRSRTEIGDLIMNIVGPPLGKLALIPKSLPQANFNQAAVLIRPYLHKDIINVYLKAYLEEMSEINSISTKGSAGQVNISLTQSQNIRIPLPPLQEQIRINNELRLWLTSVQQIEDGRETLNLVIKQTKSKILDLAIHGKLAPQNPNDEPASELLKRINPKAEIACDNPRYGKLPKGWCICNLKDLCVFLSRGKSPKYLDQDKRFPVFAQKCNLKDGGISLEQARFLDPATIDKWSEVYKLKTGDILVNSTGTGTVGRTRLFNEKCLGKYPFVVPDSHVSVIRTFENISSEYIYAYISSDTMQGYIFDNLAGSTNQKELYIGILENMLVSLPPIQEQHRIVAKIEELFAQLDKIEASL